MEKPKKSKIQKVSGAEGTVRQNGEEPSIGAHLIRIADQETRRRAITALGKAPKPYCGFTDYRFLVTDEHLEVLTRKAIPFEVLS